MAKNETKRVLFTSHTANFSKFNRPYMRWFKEQGWEVHYASMGEEEVKDCDKHFSISFARSPFSLDNIKAVFQLKRVLKNNKYDIIHTHTPMGSVVTRIAARRARKSGARIIYTAHGFHFFKGAAPLNWLVYFPIEWIMAHYTDTIVTLNREDYERAKKHFRSDIRYVPGVGVDFSKFKVKKSPKLRRAKRQELSLPVDSHVVIYVAEISKRKNQKALIDDWRNLKHEVKETHVLLVGEDSLNGKVQRQVKGAGIQDFVHFLGYRNDIPELLMASDKYVSYSTQEGLAVNIIEARVAGLPIHAVSARGVNDIIDEPEIEVFEIKNVLSIMKNVYESKGKF